VVHVRLDPQRTTENVLRRVPWQRASPFGPELRAAAEDAFVRLLLPSAERAIRIEKAAAAEDEALNVFQRNLEAILLAAPLGPRAALGIDPGLRTGCECAHLSDTGPLLDHRVLPLATGSSRELGQWLVRARPRAVAVGNGTGGREALQAAREAAREAGIDVVVVSVSEAGASVYSASDGAREELPDVDLTMRSAVHIARRLQDPLAELVKVPPQSLGVGQYQHDVDERRLASRLHDVVESWVNRVGVDVNTASPALLSYVAGIGPKLAAAIVRHRQEHGPFCTRRALRELPGLGPEDVRAVRGVPARARRRATRRLRGPPRAVCARRADGRRSRAGGSCGTPKQCGGSRSPSTRTPTPGRPPVRLPRCERRCATAAHRHRSCA
jgi:uncharacterized protein